MGDTHDSAYVRRQAENHCFHDFISGADQHGAYGHTFVVGAEDVAGLCGSMVVRIGLSE